MTQLDAQKFIIHWLLCSFWISKRAEIMERVNPEWLEEPYKQIFVTHRDYFLDNKPMGLMDFNVLAESYSEENVYAPYRLNEAIEALNQARFEKIVTSKFSETLRGEKKPQDFIRDTESILHEVYNSREGEEKTDIRSVLDEVLEIEAVEGWGLPTSFKRIDEITGGIRKGSFWIIGGYANVGKTGFVVRLAENLCSLGKNVMFYSLEMTRGDLGKKFVDYITKHKREKRDAYDILSEYKLNIVNKKRSIQQIENHLFGLKQKPDIVIIDYLHLLTVEGLPASVEEYRRISTISSSLKNLAQSTGVPIIALSQVSNESAKSKSIDLMGFKGSGALAADCDVGIVLVRDYDKENTEHVDLRAIIRKNRFGEAPMAVNMEFNKKTGFIL